MSPLEQMIERMHGINPLPDLDAISADELAAVTALLDERKSDSLRRTNQDVVRARPAPAASTRRRLRPVAVFSAAVVLVLAAVGVPALLPGLGGDVTDIPPTTAPATPTTTRAPGINTEPTVAPPRATDLVWSRVPHDEALFGGEDMGEAGFTNAGMFDVAFGHGVWVTVGWESGVLGPDNAFVDRASALYSEDGISWVPGTGDALFDFGEFPWPDGGAHLRSVAATDTGFVAVGYEMNDSGTFGAVWTSPNGRKWTRVAEHGGVFGRGENEEIRGVVSSGNLVIAVGRRSNAAAAWRSLDGGTTWVPVPHDPQVFGHRNTTDEEHDRIGDGLQSIDTVIATADGLLAAGIDDLFPDAAPQPGEFDAVVWRSADGMEWERVPDPTGALAGEGSQLIRTIIALPSGFVATGTELFGGPESPGSRVAVWHSTDLTSWVRVPHDPAVFGNDNEASLIHSAAMGPTGIIAVGQTGDDPTRAAVWASPDGVEWIRIDASLFGDGSWLKGVVAIERGYVLVGGENLTEDWWTAHGAVWIASLSTG